MTAVNPRDFWDNKILRWEEGRYGESQDQRSVLERLAKRASSSVRNRQIVAARLIGECCRDRRVVEIGCGSGRLAAPLMAAGAASYTGYDVAPAAIAEAERRRQDDGLADTVTFVAADIQAMPALEADIVFSLGLFDWLTDAEIALLFEKCGDADFLHSFSEKRATASQWLHRFYVFLAYGWRTGAYVPRYQTAGELAALARVHGPRPINVYRDPALAFGAMLSTLPGIQGSPVR